MLSNFLIQLNHHDNDCPHLKVVVNSALFGRVPSERLYTLIGFLNVDYLAQSGVMVYTNWSRKSTKKALKRHLKCIETTIKKIVKKQEFLAFVYKPQHFAQIQLNFVSPTTVTLIFRNSAL